MWEIQPGVEDVPTAACKQCVQVPGLVDLAVPQYDWRQHKYHWYRKVLKIDSPIPSETALLTLEQAMFGTEVWLNGRRVGSDIACYTSQEYDVGASLIPGADNELLVRVGARETLPQESAVGKDQERTDFIPGIWGDVHLTLCGNPRIKLVQVIPHIESKSAEARVTIANNSERESRVRLRCMVQERRSGRAASPGRETAEAVPPRQEVTLTLSLPIQDLQLWSPKDPFLYQVESNLSVNDAATDSVHTKFGMREFRIVGPDFFLNDEKVFLKGGNIAFHRFLSDANRGGLPWDLDWVKKLLIDIPKAHNFNFFRNHIGQMYNRWYDIADEYGMLLQNEWMFWTTTGTKEQIKKEFTRWLQDNGNHPSIIIWDALNECSDDVVQKEIVPEMKKLDPTRPWESVDFFEQHPYIYSLGPVLHKGKLGSSESLVDIEHSSKPSVVNEFLWWWLDKNVEPTVFTREVVERWLGKEYTNNELLDRQSFLAQELVELFRRMRVDAIQPFVYLSNNEGPTAHWFMGNIRDLRAKPILKALKNAFSSFGVSLELWDRHFFTQESRTIRLFVFNDDAVARSGTVRYGIANSQGKWVSNHSLEVSVDACGISILPIEITLPQNPGEYRIRAELLSGINTEIFAYSQKVAHVFNPPHVLYSDNNGIKILVLSADTELSEFLKSIGASVEVFDGSKSHTAGAIIMGEPMLRDKRARQSLGQIAHYVKNGATLVLLEPEYGIDGKEEILVLEELSMIVERREDADKGGYDSYVFAEDHRHPLWSGIERKHLTMFNGGFGGEVVSQHDIVCNRKHDVFARCGLKLGVVAVFEVPYGNGRVIISRLQLRGRLVQTKEPDTLYARRVDPVLQQYLINLISYACHIV